MSAGTVAWWLTSLAFESPADVTPLRPDSPVRDLGAFRQGQAQAEFVVTNEAHAPIEIAHVAKTCRCTDVNVSPKQILPGEHATVECTWDTNGPRGKCASSFDVYYTLLDDPAEERPPLQSITLVVQAEVQPSFQYSPEALDFSYDEAATKRIVFSASPDHDDVHLVSVRCDDPAFSPQLLDSHTVGVEALFENATPSQPLDATLYVTTDCPTEQLVTIPLRIASD